MTLINIKQKGAIKMNTNKKTTDTTDAKVILSTSWIFVMLNIIFADIFSFMNPEFLKGLLTGYAEQVQITPELLLGFAIATEIPIVMVLLSRILKYTVNRWANIIAGIITVVYVIGGGSSAPHAIFFIMVEVAACLFIVWYAWRWPNPDV